MSSGAGLSFLGWVRSGLVQALRAPAGSSGNLLDATLPGAATLPLSLTLTGAGTAGFDAQIVGPGDVVGIDPRQVIRCDPPPGANTVPPNFFACVEFDRPDLPWMLTPGAAAEAQPGDADARRGLRPWLCLVVVADRALDPPTTSRPLPRLVAGDDELPDLESAWLWAHAQVLSAPGEDLRTVIAQQPARTLSRLVCPRRLDAATNYLACVVPCFDAGRRAGLGLSVADGPLAPAWRRGATPARVELPVYHAWRFSTARVRGDFEALARQIRAQRLGNAGVVPLDVGAGGAGLPGPATGEAAWRIPLEGVIVGTRIIPGEWPGDWPGSKLSRLQAALSTRLAGGSGELAPPCYGALHARYAGALVAAAAPRWLGQLNLDPRYRVMAALGTRIVQQHQEALVAAAWEQTAAMREANRLLRQAQLARAVGEVYDARLRTLATTSPGRLLQLTLPVHGLVRAGAGKATVAAVLARSAPLRSALSLAFRRVARPGGPLSRRLAPALLDNPVLRLAAPAASSVALRPTERLATIAGTFDLGRAAAGNAQESLATLTRARVETPLFAWEATASPATAPPPNVPFAYQSDLLITTQSIPGNGAPDGPRSTHIGRSLDFDGAPQLGWQPLANRVVDWSNRGDGFAGGYLERGPVCGVLRAGGRTVATGFQPCLVYRPGYMLAGTGNEITGADLGSTPLAIAFADLGGNGAIDVVLLQMRQFKIQTGASPGSVWFDDVYETYLAVGQDFDPATGKLRGGWAESTPLTQYRSKRPEPPRLSAAGTRLFMLEGKTLRVFDLHVESPPFASRRLVFFDRSIDFPLAPEFLGGDIVASDFGGLNGIDLLVAYVEGSDGNLQVGYRVAYDIDAQGRIGRLGPAFRPPIAAVGAHIEIALGISDAAGAGRRAESTAAFRAAAGRTQARQERIAAVSVAPAAAPAVNTAPLALQLQAAMAPATAVQASVAARLVLPAATDLSALSDPLQPLALTPRFPTPTFPLLRDAFQERLFPGAAGLADDSATLLAVDRRALEAFLVGMNHEMSRELLWRQFPVRHGTFFARFWEGGGDDIADLGQWSATSELGSHAPTATAQPSLLLAVRAELLRRIPDAVVYAVPAKAGANGGRTPDLTRPLAPLFGGRLNPDIRFFAFGDGLTPAAARGSGASDGWYFVFQEHPTAPRFGLDEAPDGYGSMPATWADLAWPQLADSAEALAALVYVDAGKSSPLAGLSLRDRAGSTQPAHRWGFSAAHMAHITLQRSVLVAIHGSDLIAGGRP